MVTITDISRRAGVSPSVVSRIVNGDRSLRVSAETRSRVTAIIDETGYAPNIAARNLRSAQSGLIALLVHDITNPVYSEIVAGAQTEAARHGKVVLVGEANSLGSNTARLEQMILGGGVDALILQGAGTELDATIERAAARKVPLVFLQSGDEALAPVLSLDDRRAAAMATEHLIAHGHRRIGFVCTRRGLQFTEERLIGWQEAMAAHGLGAPPLSDSQDWVEAARPSFESGYEAAKQLLEQSGDLTALVVANILSAVGARALLKDLGKSVPEEISIIGIHDTEIAHFMRPALTVVAMPLRQLGEAAVRVACMRDDEREALLRDHDTKAASHLFQQQGPTLIERSSVGTICS